MRKTVAVIIVLLVVGLIVFLGVAVRVEEKTTTTAQTTSGSTYTSASLPTTATPTLTAHTTSATLCDPSYPDVCIPPPPPDLDCGDIDFSNFRVLKPDPHRFDVDGDGIGCEGGE